MISAVKVPRAYLGFDDSLSSKATLSMEDIRFSRSINYIQKTLIAELNKIAIIHLYAHGYKNDDLVNFKLILPSPSTIGEQQKLELWRSRFEIASSAPEDMLKPEWLMKNILNMPDYEIRENLQSDKASTGGGNSGGGVFDFDFGGEDDSGGEDNELGEEDNELGGDTEDDTSGAEDEDITSSVEDEKEDLLTSGEKHTNKKLPINPNMQSKHRRYVRHAKSGRADIDMSDFVKMTKPESYKDTFDKDFFRTSSKPEILRPVSINEHDLSRYTYIPPQPTSPDMISMLERMRNAKGIGNKIITDNGTILNEGHIIEGEDVEDIVNNSNYNEIDLEIDFEE
jgi:hypothetical protein